MKKMNSYTAPIGEYLSGKTLARQYSSSGLVVSGDGWVDEHSVTNCDSAAAYNHELMFGKENGCSSPHCSQRHTFLTESARLSLLSQIHTPCLSPGRYIFFTTFSWWKAHNLCKLKIKETIETSLKLLRASIPPAFHFTEIYVALNELSEILMGAASQ